MTSICGMQSLKFENAPYLKGWASVAGKKEGEGPLGNLIFIRRISVTRLRVIFWNRIQQRFLE